MGTPRLRDRLVLLLPVLIFWMLLVDIIGTWAFMRFVHYDAQNSNLAPEFYNVELLTERDFKSLSDPQQEQVTLSDGTTHRKAPLWYERTLPNYKRSTDGKHYILVTTKGTSYLLPTMQPHLIKFGIWAALGLAVCVWNERRRRKAMGPPVEA
jgi:hypothetical protein